MHDPMWDSVREELKRERPVSRDAIERIMREVEPPDPPPWAERAWGWLVRPRQLRLSPAAGILAAASLAGIIVIATTDPAGAPSAPRTIAASVASEPEPSEPVQFVIAAAGASRVSLVGDFNDWNPDATPLQQTPAPGVWSARVRLRPGVYLYAFVVDGSEWVADSAAPRAPENAFGGPSSILHVGDGT